MRSSWCRLPFSLVQLLAFGMIKQLAVVTPYFETVINVQPGRRGRGEQPTTIWRPFCGDPLLESHNERRVQWLILNAAIR